MIMKAPSLSASYALNDLGIQVFNLDLDIVVMGPGVRIKCCL